ncbi:alpha/beta-hydrolase [Parathielavia appendiculata]|uniref:Alpha/beta-hydrolase n=1 Tax=Parathielavia appendiculata TaxID=2587402 RepID=A0AAN6TS02_9PEZI|nr:alpha/beta-hydrolase [Parathielavia appendiculata]
MVFFGGSRKVKKNSPTPEPKAQKRRTPPKPGPPAPTQFSQGGLLSSSYQQPAPFQPAGLLPAPPGWNGGAQPPTSYQQLGAYPPIIVNQHHYYLGGPLPSQAPAPSFIVSSPLDKVDLGSAVDLAKEVCQGTCIPRLLNEVLPSWPNCGNQLVRQGNGLVNEISNRLDNVLTTIDQGGYNGKEHDIFAWQPTQAATPPVSLVAPVSEKGLLKVGKKSSGKGHPKGQTTMAAAVVSGSFFTKVDYYANSRLPMNLPPLKLFIPTYPLLCLAAQYSERVYELPTGRAERDAHVSGDWRTGTKAMVIKSVPMDYMNTIVFAIRGTATFMDWAVNLDTTPTSPMGFLDDPGNLCHAGFLSVARKMVGPVASRLRQLLEEDPGRASYSLLITGHSAGGAVAALLYSHMLATSKEAESELNAVSGCFKRIHCITFGTPPISLMPLAKPNDYVRCPQARKSVFMSFVNEGDPVTRADKAYVKSLLELFATPKPRLDSAKGHPSGPPDSNKPRRGDKPTKNTTPKTTTPTRSLKSEAAGPVWPVSPCTLSCAGRIVVLRSGGPKAARLRSKKATVAERLHEGVVAQIVTDEQLRGVVWGDPVAHMMRLYAGRIEVLAVGAVTGMV